MAFRRPPVFELPLGGISYRRTDYSPARRAARPLRQRANRRADRPADRGAHRARAGRTRARCTHKSAPSSRALTRCSGKKVKYNMGGYASGRNPARREQLSKVDNRIIIGSAATTRIPSPTAGRRGVGRLAGAQVRSRARDARLVRCGAVLVRAIGTILAGLDARPDGLTQFEADRRRRSLRPQSQLHHSQGHPTWTAAEPVQEPALILLLFAMTLSLFLGETTDGLIVLAIVLRQRPAWLLQNTGRATRSPGYWR